ncbi:hypothetical protein JCM5296_005093 [Sporobolomyces johnsonii]
MMRSSLALLALASSLFTASLAQSNQTATSSAAAAASTSAIPQCALTCTLSSLNGTACEQYGVSNLTCICTSPQFQLAFYQCQTSTCSSTDLQAAEAYGAQVCQQNGTPINITAIPSGYSCVHSTPSVTGKNHDETNKGIGVPRSRGALDTVSPGLPSSVLEVSCDPRISP